MVLQYTHPNTTTLAALLVAPGAWSPGPPAPPMRTHQTSRGPLEGLLLEVLCIGGVDAALRVAHGVQQGIQQQDEQQQQQKQWEKEEQQYQQQRKGREDAVEVVLIQGLVQAVQVW